MRNLFEFLKKHKEKIFSCIVTMYVYILYVRIMCLSAQNISTLIKADHQHFILNKWQWLISHQNVQEDIFVISLIFICVMLSFYLKYRKSRYFYAALLLPVFLGITLQGFFLVYRALTF